MSISHATAEDERELTAFIAQAPSHRRGTLMANVLAFCRLLRAAGIALSVGRALEAVRALERIDVLRRDDVRAALAATLVADVDQRQLFDALFEAFWSLTPPSPSQLPPSVSLDGSHPLQGPVAQRSERVVTGDWYGGQATAPPGGPRSYSDADLVTSKDFSALRGDELRRVKKLIREIAPQLRTALSRRQHTRRHGRVIDLRRSLRRAARGDGELHEIVRRTRRHRRTDVVVLADVSGSMDRYSEFLVEFIYGLQQELRGVSTFVFSTRLFEVTPMLRARTFETALRLVAQHVDGWSGGTQIGASLADFNRRYARERVHRHTIVIVLSDGWDRGEAEELAREIAVLQRRTKRLIWLNPLLGHDAYEPLTAGMLAALPYCDDFLPVHNIESLVDFGRHLLAVARN